MDVLETVDDYNARKRREREEAEDRATRTGVACPKCGKELRRNHSWASIVAHSTFPPPTYFVAVCRPCGLEVRLEQ